MEFSSAVYGVIALSFLLYYLLSAKSKKHPPHAAGARLITGHLHLIHGGGPSAVLPHVNLATLADKHGPAFTIQLGVRRALVVSSPKLAKQIFTTTDDKTAPFQTKLAKHLARPEPVISGPHDRELRELLSSVLASETASLVNGLYTGPGRVRANVGVRVRGLGSGVVMTAVAGRRLGGGERWRRVVGEVFRLAGAAAVVVGDAFPHFGWLDVGGYEKRMRETSTEMGEIIGGWVAEHRRRKEYSGGDVAEDFVDVMLAAAVEDGKVYGQRDVDSIIKDTCKSLVAGFSNTTTIMLLRTLCLLLNNPHVMKRAQEELDKHVGRERRVVESDINNLVYLQAIVKEALRLYPPTPLDGPREFTKSCNVGGYHVPKGTWLIVNLWKLQRDQEVWMEDDPSEFRPERFLNMHENMDVKDQDYELIPFGAGRRVWHETNFCVQVLHLVLANMLQAFEFSRVSDEQVDVYEVDGVMNSKDIPLDVFVAPRLSPNLY